MAYDAFLKLDGVTGESTRKGAEGWISIQSFSWGAANPVSLGAGTGGAGSSKVTISTINIIKQADKSSPLLFQKCCAGTHYPTGSLSIRKAGGSDTGMEYMKIEMTEVFVESIQVSGAAGGDDTPTESVSLAFGSIKETYQPQKVDGTPDSAVIGQWNVKTNSSNV
jgi:type VI secretion system secreted protein Hcp